MFDLIPLPYYTPVFYNAILLLVIIAVMKLLTKGYVIDNPLKKEYASLLLLLAVILYMGLRPVSGKYFADMAGYNMRFNSYVNGSEIHITKDVYWQVFMKFLSAFISSTMFFVVCAILYILTLYKACEKWFGTNMYIPFLMLIASFSFWAYGTNGIRNGIATSLFIYALSRDKKQVKYIMFFLAFLAHGSSVIPMCAYILTLFYNKPKYYLLGWLFCISLSLAFGGVFENLFASLGFQEDRLSYLTEGNINNDNFAYTGFRWDFLIYSASAVFAGYYFIIRKKFKDKIYIQLFNIYVIANAFWILVIRANFSNRFAYLSWFLMAIVIFYPFFKQRFFQNQNKALAYTILGYFGFTYLMFLIT